MNICPSCGKGVLSPVVKSSPYMIIKESLTKLEDDTASIFTTRGKNKNGYEENTTAYYLNRELGNVGLQISTMSLSCLYLHTPPKGGRTKESREVSVGCTEFSKNQLIEVAKHMAVILMTGAETIKTFTGYNASSVYGMKVKSDLLPTVPTIIPAPNIDKMMAMPIGEFRLAIKKFAEEIKIHKQYKEMK